MGDEILQVVLHLQRNEMKNILELHPYESMQQGSWEDQFRAGENVRLLSIRDEINAALEEVDKRLASLYSLKEKVICRDFTASNILLDNKYGDGEDFSMLQKYGTKEYVENDDWDDKMTSQLQDKSTDCDRMRNKSKEIIKESMERVSYVLKCELMSIDGFDGKDTKYEHSDEAGSKQMQCIDKNMTKKLLYADDLSHELGIVYPQAKTNFLEKHPYESMQQGRLEDQFGRGENVQSFSLYKRLTPPVLDKVARVLAYLHSPQKKIIYRDFKPSNILLDNKYGDGENFSVLKKYETTKDVENDEWDGKRTSKLQDKFSGCKLNKYEEHFSQDKRKETVQRVISCLIATVVFFWFIFDTFTQSSIMQLQPLHKEHGPIFIWSSLIEPFCFMVLVWAIATSIVVGSSSSRMQSAMLMFWAILILVKSAKSITEVYVPIVGILFTGCYMFVEKQR